MSGRRRPDGEVPGSKAHEERLERERDYDRMDRQRAEERERMQRDTERRQQERERAERDRDLNEQQRREQLERSDARSAQRGDVPTPTEIADAHESGPDGGVSADDARTIGRALGSDRPPIEQPPKAPPPPRSPNVGTPPASGTNVTPGSGATSTDPADDWKPMDAWSPMRLPGDLRGCLPLIAGGGITLLGLAMMVWAFTGGRSDYGVVPGSPLVSPPQATSAATPAQQGAASGTRTATANLSFTRVSGPATLARTFSDRFAMRWNDRMVDLTQLSNDHKASGARTGNSFTARGTDGQEYRGTISESGGAAAFQGQLTGPNSSYVYTFSGETVGPIATSAPAAATTATAAPTATAGSAATTAGGEANYPLAGTGLLLSIGGLGLGLLGRRFLGRRYLNGIGGEKNPGGLVFPIPYTGGGGVRTDEKEKEETDRCARERAREAAAAARLGAARQKFEQLDSIRSRHERAQIRLAQAEHPLEAGGRSVGRGTASREVREEATGAQNAWDAAGDGQAHSAAQEELRAAEKEWDEADAALRACMGGGGGAPRGRGR